MCKHARFGCVENLALHVQRLSLTDPNFRHAVGTGRTLNGFRCLASVFLHSNTLTTDKASQAIFEFRSSLVKFCMRTARYVVVVAGGILNAFNGAATAAEVQ